MSFFSKINKTKYEVNKWVKLASSSVLAEQNNTTILVTVCSENVSTDTKLDGIPLQVNFNEKLSCASIIPHQQSRRDHLPSTHEILQGRLIDRALRPLLPQFQNTAPKKIEINVDVLQITAGVDTASLALNAASLALETSGIKLLGMAGCVRVGFDAKNRNEIYPLIDIRDYMDDRSEIDLILAANEHSRLLMIEGACKMLDNKLFKDTVSQALELAGNVAQELKEISRKVERKMTSDEKVLLLNSDLNKMNEFFDPKLDNDIAKRLFGEKYEKSQFIENASLLKSEVEEAFISKMPESHPIYFDTLYNRVVKRVYQNSLLDGKCLRIDGRHEQDLRKIDMSIGNLNAHHGSAIFSRGLTSVLSLVTFGYEGYSLNENHAANMLIRDPFKTQNKFFLHYEFPAYCNGEVSKPNFGSGAKRRELGHGNLAQRALQYAVKKSIPDELFAIRALNKVLCSNGSSSMASVCASNLALQNAGLRFTENIAGIAMGLANIQPRKLNFDSIEHNNFEDIDENFKPLTDITGIEDALGEIDLKIASSESKLVTSIQADVKSATGISDYVLRCLISRALKVNQNIAMSMKASVESSEQSKKLRFPIVKEISLPLGTRYRIQNSKVLIKLKDYAGSHLAFVENDINVDGKVKLFSPDSENLEKALQIIEELTSSYEYELELGAIYSVKVIKVQSNGLYVQIHPSFSPILISFSMLDTSIAPHLSKESKIKPKNNLSSSHELENMFKEGQELIVKYMGRDPINGKHLLSRRAIFMHGSNTIAHQSHYFKSLRDAMAESED